MENRVRAILFCSIALIVFPSCKKIVEAVINHSLNHTKKGQYIRYTIQMGEHYSDQNFYQSINQDELRFTVKFDSSCIYNTTEPANQEDINKLYGFSDNNADHQQYSARFGWNWTRDSLRLYAYIYNNGVRDTKEITTIEIGKENYCSIKVFPGLYTFNLNNMVVDMPRASSTSMAEGYKLFPYFGGDETSPHQINIWIKEL